MKTKLKSSIVIRFGSLLTGIILLVSCQPERSSKTGWHYNSPEKFGSGYEKFPAMDQETGPGLTLIEGGMFTMGRTERLEFMPANDDSPRKVTVPSFYMDQTEVSNFEYLEYLYWLGRVYGSVNPLNPSRYNPDGDPEEEGDADTEDPIEAFKENNDSSIAFLKYAKNYSESFTSNYQEVFRKALPDTLCWRSPLAAMEHFVNYYLRHPAYRDYPVVGVSWIQANDYCKWRTDRVNEYILAREGILDWEMGNKELNPFQMFSTEAYLSGQYYGLQPNPREANRNYSEEEVTEEEVTDEEEIGDKIFTQKSQSDNGRRLRNYNPSARSVNKGGKGNYGARIVRMEDGILLPNYRLPTEAEWEYAATGLIGNLQDNSENITDRRTYPWDGHWVRREEEQFQGSLQGNFMRSQGDYMGIAGNSNDGACPTAPVESFWPNDFGLFHMAGNVSEWVQDVYRPNSLDDVDGFSPFRGNLYTTKLTTTIGLHDAMKNDRTRYDVHGMKQYVLDFERVRYQRIAGSDGKSKGEWDPNKRQGNGINETDFDFYYEYDIVTACKLDTINYPFISVPASGDIINKYKTSLTYTLSDKKNFNIDSSGVISAKDFRMAPGKYPIVVTVEKPGSTPKLKFTYNVQFNVLDKKPIDFSGINNQSKSKYAAQFQKGASPDQLFVSSGNKLDVYNVKGSQYKKELQFIDSVHAYLDSAIHLTNNLKTTEATRVINRGLWGRVFSDAYISRLFPDYLDDPALTTMIGILRNGLTEYIIETEGQMRYRRVTEEENLNRQNYRKDDYIDYMDGDVESSIYFQNENRKNDINLGKRDPKMVMYQSNHERYNLDGSNIGTSDWDQGQPTSLISDRSRVYKGGSWEDNAYWLGCGRRRFLDETQSTRNIGFRCAMDRVGSPTGKNYGKKKKRKS